MTTGQAWNDAWWWRSSYDWQEGPIAIGWWFVVDTEVVS